MPLSRSGLIISCVKNDSRWFIEKDKKEVNPVIKSRGVEVVAYWTAQQRWQQPGW
jgi:hypothetical protein